MPFFENAGDYVPDFSLQQIHLYQSLLRQKAETSRQIQVLIDSVPKVPRPKWHCLRCDHTWNGYFPRKKPKFCTNCQSRYWDRERVKSMDAVRSRKVSREESLNPITLPKSLASVTGMTPPPVFNDTDDRLKAIADSAKRPHGLGEIPMQEIDAIAKALEDANRIPRRNRFAEDIVEVPSSVEPEPVPVPVTEEASVTDSPGQKSVVVDEEGPHCCSKPLIVDGFCLSCGDGLEVKHG